jgi:CarD family transcriptional regulator
MVPISSCERAGMRKLMGAEEVEEIYNILKMPAQFAQGTWNKRSRKLQQKLRSGSLNDMAEVLRDLSAQQEQKGLSFGEKQMLNKCRELVIAEISIASNKPTEQIETNITAALAYH